MYQNVITAGYRFHDMMLERLLQLAGPDTTVILMSDHGFHPDHLRPIGIPKEPAGPAAEHRELGVLVMNGPSIQPGESIYGATLLDIAPTILTFYGLPMGADMNGKPILNAFTNPPDFDVIPSWEDVAGSSGMHNEDARRDPWAESQMMEQLIALGYIDPPGEKVKEAIEKTTRESQYYLARVHFSNGRLEKAIPILETLYDQSPDQTRYGLRLAQYYQQVDNLIGARRVVNEVLARQEKSFPALDILRSSLLLAENKPGEALILLNQTLEKAPARPGTHIRIGKAYLQLEQYRKAELAFTKAIEFDSDNAQAYHGLAVAYLYQEMYEEAADAALQATDRIYYLPAAHYHLGVALQQLREFEHAAEAFQVAVQQSPGMKRAHLALIELYETHLGQPGMAAVQRQFVQEMIRSGNDSLSDNPETKADSKK
ncbi:MAG: tetratricopeptide repeat protein [Chloroflexi bacterium]|nr:tetratricopeptide repeat protein [Chloroflexota bacterium]